MKFCPRLLIFEPLDCTLGIFRAYDFSIFKYCYFWIDILGFLIQTFEPAPPPRMFSYGVPPWAFCLSCGRMKDQDFYLVTLKQWKRKVVCVAELWWCVNCNKKSHNILTECYPMEDQSRLLLQEGNTSSFRCFAKWPLILNLFCYKTWSQNSPILTIAEYASDDAPKRILKLSTHLSLQIFHVKYEYLRSLQLSEDQVYVKSLRNVFVYDENIYRGRGWWMVRGGGWWEMFEVGWCGAEDQ